MNINKWIGIVSAASPYSIPPGAAVEQTNLQVRKPGQLVPRPGMTPVYGAATGAMLSIYRDSPGNLQADRLIVWQRQDEEANQHQLDLLVSSGAGLTRSEIFSVSVSPANRPSLCQDRHGTTYAFFGSGIRPQTFRYGIDERCVAFGMDAPKIAPQVEPTGDGWFIERVDVLSSGTSYYTPPAVTVSGGNPTRPAVLRAVVQAGAIVAVDVVDGGSNYRGVPTITVSNLDQVGEGFQAIGFQTVAAATYGFLESGAGAKTGSYDSATPKTHSFDLSNASPKIAIWNGVDTVGVSASYSPIDGTYTALIPLTPGGLPAATTATITSGSNQIVVANATGLVVGATLNISSTYFASPPIITAVAGTTLTLNVNAIASGSAIAVSIRTPTGAYAQVRFNPLSAAYKLGDNAVTGFVDSNNAVIGTGRTTATLGSATVQYRTNQSGWFASNDYFENTYSPVGFDVENNVTYSAKANIDSFWGLMPSPGVYRFTKRQIRYKRPSTDMFDSTDRKWADYYFPDYDKVGYRILTGPATATGMASESNWTVGSATVQDANTNFPYIDIPLSPAKKADGSSYATTPNVTVFPTIRVHLKKCPDAWVVDNIQPLTSGDDDDRRYTPQSGQDRRQNQSDTSTGQSSSNPSGTLSSLSGNAQDQYKRWWNVGFVGAGASGTVPAAGWALPRPLVDFRQSSATDNTGVANGTVQIVNAGAQLEQGTKFAIRFEQYNSYDYRWEDKSKSFDWRQTPPSSKYLTITNGTQGMVRRGGFGASYTDLLFEANAIDNTGSNPLLLLPGAVSTATPPKVVISGSGWTGENQKGSFQLRQRTTTSGTFSDSEKFEFSTTTLAPASSTKSIGSITIQNGGQYYYREPTILFKGGGGYGLRVQSTIANGQVTGVNIIDGGDGFTGSTYLYTSVEPAKLMPILRGTMRGKYRCAYRFADYRQTVVLNTTITTTSGSTTATIASAAGVLPGMQITGASACPHLNKIVSIVGTTITLAKAATATVAAQACVIRDMSLPIVYSDFSPITDIDASANGSGRASKLQWTLTGVTAPDRAEFVEFYRTSADQSLLFYRLDMYGTVTAGAVTMFGEDGLSDEELFNIDRPAYAALPVVLPNGGVNAYRFGTARNDMAVAVAWQDRLWYGVSTSGDSINTVFFSEYDEFESCPDVNELPIQVNLRSSDYLTALIPFGSVLMAMQTSHCYAVAFNTDPVVDASITLVAHRGVMSQQCWDIFDDAIYAADERGVYRMSKNGEVESLSEVIRDVFDESKLDLSKKQHFFLRVDQRTGILRFFVSFTGHTAVYPHMALCLHIENKAWWVESWPNSLTCSGDYRASGKPDTPIYGAVNGGIYEMSGLRDAAFRDVKSVAVSNGGSGYTTPPTVSAPGGSGAVFKALVENGKVTEILVIRGGYGYGSYVNAVFQTSLPLTISAPPSGTTAQATADIRPPSLVGGLVPQTTVPWMIRTGPLELMYEGNTRNGDRQIDRSITVVYKPTAVAANLILREYYNNADSPRVNAMRRDRGTGFVHETSGAKTTLNMSAARTSLGLATGIAKAVFAGRSLEDMASADRHIAIELSCDPADANAENPNPPEPLIYAVEVNGVSDGR